MNIFDFSENFLDRIQGSGGGEDGSGGEEEGSGGGEKEGSGGDEEEEARDRSYDSVCSVEVKQVCLRDEAY